MTKALLAITMGDPFGNGPELIIKALNHKEIYDACKPIIVGDKLAIKYANEVQKNLNGIDLKINVIDEVKDAKLEFGTIDLIDVNILKEEDISNFDKPENPKPFNLYSTKLGGEISFLCVEKAIKLAMDKEVDGTVTNALSKEAINMAGHHYSGHTEIYADSTKTKSYAMMLAHENMRVVHVSTHVSLREACDRVKKDRVLECIKFANEGCKALGIENPRIAVAGLNPHCGENGMFGREEIEEIQPAIDEALKMGIDIPDKKATPADTVFSKLRGDWYDIVVVMYHDQGHIPMKVIGFNYNKEEKKWDAVEGVNVTLGLPIVRTSVDHGTGYDKAGDGSANELSLLKAIDYAYNLSEYNKENSWKK